MVQSMLPVSSFVCDEGFEEIVVAVASPLVAGISKAAEDSNREDGRLVWSGCCRWTSGRHAENPSVGSTTAQRRHISGTIDDIIIVRGIRWRS